MVQLLRGLALVDWCPVGGTGSVDVVVDTRVLDDHSGFEEAVELPQAEQFVSKAGVERLRPGVLPR